jgi:hypothetical protein
MEDWSFEFSKIPKSAHELMPYGKNSEIQKSEFQPLSEDLLRSLFFKT